MEFKRWDVLNRFVIGSYRLRLSDSMIGAANVHSLLRRRAVLAACTQDTENSGQVAQKVSERGVGLLYGVQILEPSSPSRLGF